MRWNLRRVSGDPSRATAFAFSRLRWYAHRNNSFFIPSDFSAAVTNCVKSAMRGQSTPWRASTAGKFRNPMSEAF